LATMGSVAAALQHCYRERETPNADAERTPDNEHRAATASGVSTSFEKIPLRSTRGSMACGVMVACPGWRS
ncbi:plasmid recombination enzyme, partial [Pseudomonas aeruginosa]|nr:plasmid recombination enzyme [Pseudomonas aeruginosa]